MDSWSIFDRSNEWKFGKVELNVFASDNWSLEKWTLVNQHCETCCNFVNFENLSCVQQFRTISRANVIKFSSSSKFSNLNKFRDTTLNSSWDRIIQMDGFDWGSRIRCRNFWTNREIGFDPVSTVIGSSRRARVDNNLPVETGESHNSTTAPLGKCWPWFR